MTPPTEMQRDRTGDDLGDSGAEGEKGVPEVLKKKHLQSYLCSERHSRHPGGSVGSVRTFIHLLGITGEDNKK